MASTQLKKPLKYRDAGYLYEHENARALAHRSVLHTNPKGVIPPI